MSDELRRMRHAWTSDRNGLIARAELAESQNQALQERAEKAEAALREIANTHQTFASGQADIRGQHCLDLERIARNALSPTQETDPG